MEVNMTFTEFFLLNVAWRKGPRKALNLRLPGYNACALFGQSDIRNLNLLINSVDESCVFLFNSVVTSSSL